MFQVNKVMTDRVVSVGPSTTIDDAITLILDHQISGLPVVDEEHRLLGVISEMDIIDLVYRAEIGASAVGDHMTRDVLTLDVEASIDDAASIFCTHSIRRVPVIKDGKLVGVLSRRDLIRFLRDVRNPVGSS